MTLSLEQWYQYLNYKNIFLQDILKLKSFFLTRFVDGVDLNCGCPQRWIFSDGHELNNIIIHSKYFSDSDWLKAHA